MKLPWVSRRAYELALAYQAELVAHRDSLIREIEREREANRNLMASALALRNLSNPYRPANMTAPPGPIGKTTAAKMILELEAADRKSAQEKQEPNVDPLSAN